MRPTSSPPRWFVVLALLALSTLPFVPTPAWDDSPVAVALLNACHVPLGFLLVAGLRAASPRLSLGIAGCFALGIGGGIEIAQWLSGTGDPSWFDFANDAGGVLLALAWLSRTDRPGARVARALATVTALALPLSGLATTIVSEQRRRALFPQLGAFEQAGELRAWRAADGATIARVPEHATEGRFALRCDFAPGALPTVALTAPPPDWSAYDTLAFDIDSPQSEPLALAVKITDRIAWKSAADRFERDVVIPPGASTVRIALSDVAAGPTGRRLDLTRIKTFVLRLRNPGSAHRLFLDNVRLDRDGVRDR